MNAFLKTQCIEALRLLILEISPDSTDYNLESFLKVKAIKSGRQLATLLGLNESLMDEFVQSWKRFEQEARSTQIEKINALRLLIWLDGIHQKLGTKTVIFKIAQAEDEEIAIKQVRALELLLRDLLTEQTGGSVSLVERLKQLLNIEVIQKWINNADQSGILSGTTFSELSNLFIDKNLFNSYESIFKDKIVSIERSSRDTLRIMLNDIRLVRNQIAHNKRVSHFQVEALNEYYNEIAELIRQSAITGINPDQYLRVSSDDIINFCKELKADHQLILDGLETLKGQVSDIRSDTQELVTASRWQRKQTKILVIGIIVILLVTVAALMIQRKASVNSEQIGKDIREVKEYVRGDSEIKNMSSSDDLTATKELNERTKDVNAIRVAIIYFDNSSGEAALDKLKKGLADMMISDMSGIQMLSIVERDRLETILKEQKLNNTSAFDAGTASKLGKLLGAQVILTGAYFEMLGSLRIDARFIDVETGKILKSDGVEGEVSNFFKIQKQLTWKIIRNIDAKVTPAEEADLKKIEKAGGPDFEAIQRYSEALDLFDRGNKLKAAEIINTLLAKYPYFGPAKNLLSKIQSL